MSAFLSFVASVWARLAVGAAKVGLSAAAIAFLGPLGPIVSGIGQVIGAAVTAIGEILASLSKSAEGRVTLCLMATLLGFLYLRFYYIEEGKAIARAKFAVTQKTCPTARVERRSR
jgi:hypothetical protein